MISEGSCDTEDWSNDAEKSALPSHDILEYIKIENIYFKGTILPMSLLRFCAFIMVISLLSIECQRALRFHKHSQNLCSEKERRSYEFGTT